MERWRQWGDEFLKKSYTRAHTHTYVHTAAAGSDWQRPTDTPTDWKKDERKESDRGKGKDRERRSDPQPHTNRNRQQRDKQKDRQTDGPSDSHLLYLSVRVLSCSVKHLVTNRFDHKYWFCLRRASTAAIHEKNSVHGAVYIRCAELSAFGNVLHGDHPRHRKWCIFWLVVCSE